MTTSQQIESTIIVAGVNADRQSDSKFICKNIATQKRNYRNVEEIPSLLKMNRHLKTEVVCIASDVYGPSRDDLVLKSAIIAAAVAEHQNKPWVLLDKPWMVAMKPAFEAAGVPVVTNLQDNMFINERLRALLEQRYTAH